MRLSNSSYLIIGAYGGIGSTVCHLLKENGANCILAGSDIIKLQALSNQLSSPFFALDASDFSQMDSLFEFTLKTFGHIDGVVNCCGSLLLKPAHITSESEYFSIIQSNLTSSFATIRSGCKAMMGKGGSVVLISSAAAKVGLSNHEAIACAKAGIIGLTKSAAATYSSKNIRVNCVAPGLVNTALTKTIINNENALKASISMHPLGKIGSTTDIASAVLWLLDPANSWITGQTIVVDGGLSSLKTRG
ncbi:MAG: SDR family oxidoreductase [Planctomycetes bacterium]|nr:SDR family oxidoreductase [Planctomycetota bacterium]